MMESTTLIFLLCLGFTFSRGNVEEDITDVKALLRKAMSEIGELKRDNALLKQEIREITPLRHKIRGLEMDNSLLRHEFGNLAKEVEVLRDVVGRECRRNDDSSVNGETETINNHPRIRKLSPDALIATSNPVAFFVYMSSNIQPGADQILKFNVIELNLGNGYHSYSGIFSAPEDGVYGFSYGITCGVGGSLYFRFMKNGNILIVKRCDNDEDSDDYKELSGTIITQLASNDEFYISTQRSCTTSVTSYAESKSFFSGWKIN